MTYYKIRLSKKVIKTLNSFPKSLRNRIHSKLEFYGMHCNPLLFAKKLKGFGSDTYRFRVGDYRLIFRVDKNGVVFVLFVIEVVHRREAY